METEKSLSTEDKPKATKKKSTGADAIIGLERKIENLELTVRMMAHFNGTNRVLDKCGLERWEPSKKELRRA
jgi:hypothetical protein